MITVDTVIGDTVTNWYGEVNKVVGESAGGGFWILKNVDSGREMWAHKLHADTVVFTSEGE